MHGFRKQILHYSYWSIHHTRTPHHTCNLQQRSSIKRKLSEVWLRLLRRFAVVQSPCLRPESLVLVPCWCQVILVDVSLPSGRKVVTSARVEQPWLLLFNSSSSWAARDCLFLCKIVRHCVSAMSSHNVSTLWCFSFCRSLSICETPNGYRIQCAIKGLQMETSQ